MPELSKYDMGYRPQTYWIYEIPYKRAKATVKGNIRRVIAEKALRGDPIGFSDPYAVDQSLPNEEREARGRLHPMFMGGEYLPDYEKGEVEVARICYNSVLGDVVSIRARQNGGQIFYNVVNEYGDPYIIGIKCSEKPLTFEEIIRLIDTSNHYAEESPCGLVMSEVNYIYNSSNIGFAASFISSVESAFYSELGSWYEEVIDEWYKEKEELLRLEEEKEKEKAEEEERQAQLKKQRDDELIETSPQMSPRDFLPSVAIEALSRVDFVLLSKWIAGIASIQPATISLEYPRCLPKRYGWQMSKIRYFYIDWMEEGIRREICIDDLGTTIQNAFKDFLEIIEDSGHQCDRK